MILFAGTLPTMYHCRCFEKGRRKKGREERRVGKRERDREGRRKVGGKENGA